MINEAEIQGEPGTGFEKRGGKGPFECGNCEYFDGSSCGQDDMMKLSKQPRTESGRVQVSTGDCCEYVERRGEKLKIPTIYLIRHGNTALNDPKDERLRGWSDVPLNGEGLDHAAKSAERLREFGVRHLLASDLQRAMMTAYVIGERCSLTPKPTRGLRPWNLGDFTEKPLKEIITDLNYYQEFVNIRVPGGESYAEFYRRWEDTIDRIMTLAMAHPDEPLAAVTHSRNLLSLPSILGNTGMGDVPVKGGPEPAQIVKLTARHGDDFKMEII